jgi:hypothetical protein
MAVDIRETQAYITHAFYMTKKLINKVSGVERTKFNSLNIAASPYFA